VTHAITLHGLGVRYGHRWAVRGVSGAFVAGAMAVIVGPNGAGKSTLLAAIAGALAPASGEVRVHGVAQADVAWLSQQSGVDRDFPVRVLDVVMLGLWRRVGAFGGATRAMREEALDALATVGLAGFAQRTLVELSVGQFQRVRFARVLLQRARIVLLDEPFNAVDARTTDELLALLHAWRAEGRTVVAVLHDLELARTHFEHALLLAREPVAWGTTAEVLTDAHLARARALSDGWAQSSLPAPSPERP
jgi:zinc/manganese transport system ATP-binding protein